jgi:hypothetical protein
VSGNTKLGWPAGGNRAIFQATIKDMGKRLSDWFGPPGALINLLGLIPVAIIAILAGVLLPVLESLQSADLYKLYFSGLGIAGFGAILLFLARLPLYRKGRFWAIGPGELNKTYRRLYWLAYLIILAGLGLLGIVWLRTS